MVPRKAMIALPAQLVTITAMKFALAILVYLLMGAVIGVGVLLLIAGKPLLFIIGLVAFILAFAKFGCLTQH